VSCAEGQAGGKKARARTRCRRRKERKPGKADPTGRRNGEKVVASCIDNQTLEMENWYSLHMRGGNEVGSLRRRDSKSQCRAAKGAAKKETKEIDWSTAHQWKE